jgi:hypothetical protein
MSHCPDCGCRTNNGLCSNCHEEAYIIENQGEYIDSPVSQEFSDKAAKQFKDRAKKTGHECE